MRRDPDFFAQDIAVETGLSESKAIACLQAVSNLHRTEIATGAFTPLLLLEQTRCKFAVAVRQEEASN